MGGESACGEMHVSLLPCLMWVTGIEVSRLNSKHCYPPSHLMYQTPTLELDLVRVQ